MDRWATGERDLGLRHVRYAELMERKAKGLCFRCGERYSPLDHCADPRLRLLVLGNDETVIEEEVVALEVEEDQTKSLMECKVVGLCGISEVMTEQTGQGR